MRIDELKGGVAPVVIIRLVKLEAICGWKLDITSGYREGDLGCHGRGLAVDIRVVGGKQRMDVVKGLIFLGFGRIGVYDKHVHGDLCGEPLPQGVIWQGVSK